MIHMEQNILWALIMDTEFHVDFFFFVLELVKSIFREDFVNDTF